LSWQRLRFRPVALCPCLNVEAEKLIQQRDSFNTGLAGVAEPAKSEAELARELAALRAKVRAYKADDPQ